MQNITIHIDQLVLHGFDATDARGLEEAVERELLHVFERFGISSPFPHSLDLPFTDAGSFESGNAPGISNIGKVIAGSIYKSTCIESNGGQGSVDPGPTR